MERHHLSDTREAVAGDVVEVVATQVEQARVGREAARDFGVASVLTRGVLRHHLKVSKMLQFITSLMAFYHVLYSSQIKVFILQHMPRFKIIRCDCW